MSIQENVIQIKNRIATVCQKANRDPKEIEIIAVSKTVSASSIKEAIEAGITNIGENRVQEAWKKYNEIDTSVRWHMVGRLQTNKVKRALQFFDIIHSVENRHLAEEINKRACALNRDGEILIEVNTSGESTKIGVTPDGVIPLIKSIATLPHLRITGLMTIGVFLPDPEQVRPCFIALRQIQQEVIRQGFEHVEMKFLSMGMTDDFEVAIEEGSNMVRIGRAIFGERQY